MAEQNCPGLEVQSRGEGFGNVLMTTQQFSTGSIVLAETPLLTFNDTDVEDYISKFSDATAEVQEKVLDMCHRSLEEIEADVEGESQYARSRAKEAELAQKYSLSLEKVTLLLDIRHTNAYSFDDDAASLFWLAAKANHSCKPNVAYSSSSGSQMVYFALCDIPAGTEVQPSYILDVYSTPRAFRRTKLLDTKNFLCQCARCLGIDDCRLLKCPTESCSEGLVYQQESAGDEWTCSACKQTYSESDMHATIQQEEDLQLRFTAIDDQMRAGNLGDPTELRNIIKEAIATLSSTHHIVAKTMRLMYRFFADQADRMESGGLGPTQQCMSPWGEVISIQSFRKEAAGATLQSVRIRECVADGCQVPACQATHEPVHEACIDALHGIKMLTSLKVSAESVYDKYKTILDRAVGPDKVKEIAGYPPVSGEPCAYCATVQEKLLRCPCKLVQYCNKKCQKDGRKAHKKECKEALDRAKK